METRIDLRGFIVLAVVLTVVELVPILFRRWNVDWSECITVAVFVALALAGPRWFIGIVKRWVFVRPDRANPLERAAQRRFAQEFTQVPWVPWSVRLAAAGAAFTIVWRGRATEPLVFAAFFVYLGLVYGLCSLSLRNTSQVRIAILNPRSPLGAIPPAWLALIIVQAFLPLTLLGTPGLTLWIYAAVAATLLGLASAWLTGSSPSLLQGNDLTSETLVDNTLRTTRVRRAVGYLDPSRTAAAI